MIKVEKIDTRIKKQVRRFTNLPFRLYENHSCWVPPIMSDHEEQLNRSKHPFYEHSVADFFIAIRDGQDVGRIAAIENQRFNEYHGTRTAQFYFFESENDQVIADALFQRVFDWARERSLNTLIGPKGLGPLDGFGILIDGFEQRQMMVMMNYNPPYYIPLLENLGFVKEVDFISCYANNSNFPLPERLYSIADRIQKRGTLQVKQFNSIRELKAWSRRIGETYNKAFIYNWEYYPITEREIEFVVKKLEAIAIPKLIKIILHDQDIVGFLFAFPDIAPAIQRSRGRYLPFGFIDMMLEMRRTKWVALNTVGILPGFQGRGGNALLYVEIEKTITEHNFEHFAVYQVAETAISMRRDLENLGVVPYKTHRVFTRQL